MNIEIIKCQARADGIDTAFAKMKERQTQNMQVLIVPEKFGVSAERAMFESTNLRAVFDMDVTTFDRLADKFVVDKNIQYLSKSAGIMLVQKIALDKSRELKILSKSTTFSGFSENIFNTIMLFKSSCVTPETLLSATSELSDVSKLKLLDIQKIYAEYEKYLQDRYIDSANKLDKLNRELEFDDATRATDFYVYSPKLTKQILSILKTLCKFAHSVTLVVEETREDDNYLVLRKLCDELGDVCEREIPKRPLDKVIKYGQRCACDCVHFVRAKDINCEIESLCTSIAQSGGRYRDNFVLVAGLDKYKTQIAEMMRELEIPYFLDTNEPLSMLAPVLFIMQMLDLASEFRIDKVLAVVKSGYLNFPQDKIFDFELYLTKWGINERNFWSANKPQDELFDNFSIIYKDFCALFDEFSANLRQSKNICEILQVLNDFLQKIKFEEKIAIEAQQLVNYGQLQKSKEYEQITKKIEQVSKQLAEILGLNTVSISDFKIIFQAGLDSVNVKTPPLTVDCVYIGDVSTAMLYRAKNLYILGAVEGNFPVFNQDCGLVQDDEIAGMRKVCDIDPTIRQVNIENRQAVQNNLVCGQNLRISYPVSVLSTEQKPATLLNEIMRSVGGIYGNTAEFVDYSGINMLDTAPDLAKNFLTRKRCERVLREIDADIEKMSVHTIFSRVCGLANKLKVDFEKPKLENICRKITKPSVSQLQEYYNCPYKNFCHYGLRLKENADNTFKAVDVGTFLHKVAELFGEYLIDRKMKFIESESAEKVFDYVIKRTFKFFELEDFGRKNKNMSAENLAILKNIAKSATLMLRAINEQNKISDFIISSVEKPINFEIECNGKNVSISGKIDRVDTFGDYVRIIDYKTGNDKFSVDSLLCGRQIQLFIYLGAIAKIADKKPVGVYYFKIKDDFTSPYSDKDFLRTYRLNGVTVNDEQLILAQDTTLNDEKLRSDIIPIEITTSYAKGEFKLHKSRSSAVEKEQLEKYIDYAYKIFEQGVKEMENGNIQQSPYKGTCDYCPYRGVLCDGSESERVARTFK